MREITVQNPMYAAKKPLDNKPSNGTAKSAFRSATGGINKIRSEIKKKNKEGGERDHREKARTILLPVRGGRGQEQKQRKTPDHEGGGWQGRPEVRVTGVV